MAKIQEQVIVVKLSKLVKDGDSSGINITDDLVQSIEAIAQELVESGVIVEVITE